MCLQTKPTDVPCCVNSQNMACLLVGSAWQLMPVQKFMGSDMSILHTKQQQQQQASNIRGQDAAPSSAAL